VIVRLAVAAFMLAHALVLRTYPKRFRQQFGRPMTLAVGDALGAAARSGGLRVVILSGSRALHDLLAGVPLERAADARDRLLWPTPSSSRSGSPTMFADSLFTDGRFALRGLRRAPLFAMLTVLALALGLGANSAIFAVVRGVLLRPLPYGDPDRLVMIWSDNRRENKPHNPISPANFADLRAGTRSFTGIEALYSFLIPQRLATQSGVETAQAAVVTPGLFRLLQRKPLMGRTFSDGETRGVVVLSHGYWRRRFGGDPQIIGTVVPLVDQAMAMNAGTPMRGAVVIGVMPPDFVFPYRSMLGPSGFSRAHDVDLWLPLAFEGSRFVDASGNPNRSVHLLSAVGRLKPGVGIQAANTDLAAAAGRLERAWPATNTGWGASAVPLLEQTVGDVKPALLLLFGGVSFVLLMTSVNVANLLLARSLARRREVAVRVALGAARRRLVQQALVESVVLGLLGGVAALVVARWGVSALLSLAPVDLPRVHAVALDGSVVAFTLTAAIGVGLMIGLVSSLAAVGFALPDALKGAGRGTFGSGGRRSLRATLVIVEVALAVVLTVGAGLLIRSFKALLDVDSGFKPESLLTLQMNVPDSYDTAPKRLAYYDALFARLDALPGVRAAGGTTRLPLGSTSVTTTIVVEGKDVPESALPESEMRRALHHYFEAMGIPVLAGRGFTREDGPGAPPVAVINRALADKLFGRENALGRRIRMGSSPTGTWLTIVGVVGNIRHQGLEVAPAPEMYIHGLQGPPVAPFVAIRAEGDPAVLAETVRAAIRSVDRATAVFDIRTMMQVRAASVSQRRFVLTLTMVFGALALALAGLGVYGVMALIVTERTQEVGVRLALGARPVQILALVLRQSIVLTSAGVALGLVMAALLAPFIASQLYGVGAHDAWTFLLVPAVLVVVAIVAALSPARGAMRVNPVLALRGEF
jgi:putative ABC transport system permease protein